MIFKREKELARKLEFDGLYITDQPEDDDIKGQWDRLVLNTPLVSTLVYSHFFTHVYICSKERSSQQSVSGLFFIPAVFKSPTALL